MPTSKVTVYRNGKLAKNVRVTLEYSGWTTSGFTQKFYTDSTGTAYVEHSSTGRASVYLDGQRKGEMNTPGQEIFYL